jgi:plasmid stability protein
MTALTIRDVPEDAVRTMKIRAAQAGQSLQAYPRSLIEREAARPTVAEAVEQNVTADRAAHAAPPSGKAARVSGNAANGRATES